MILNGSYGQPCLPPHCDKEGETSLRNYEKVFNEQTRPIISSPPSNGYFLDSCFVHCQTFQSDKTWSEYAIRGRTIAKTFGDWYMERSHETRLKDCENYPCNPSCSKVHSDGREHPGNSGGGRGSDSPYLKPGFHSDYGPHVL